MGVSHPKIVVTDKDFSPIEQKRILFFVHDGTGLGHLRRLARIAKSLQGPCACLVVSGHRAAYWFVSEDCEYVHLPSLDSLLPNKSQYWGLKPFVNMEKKEVFEFRQTILQGIIKGYKPDAIFVDYLPLGKEKELVNIIKNVPAKKYYIARGIINQNENIKDFEHILDGQAKEYLIKYYDRIFVTCDDKICNFTKEYNIEQELIKKITCVGYVSEDIHEKDINKTRKERGLIPGDVWIICSAGGGQLGEKLIDHCVRLAKQLKPKNNNVFFDIILGPRSSLDWQHSSVAYIDEDNLRLHKESRYLHYLHAAADIVISTGGYNSLVEAMQGNARIICCPARLNCQDEQYLHALYLSKLVDIEVISKITDLKSALLKAMKKIQSHPRDQRRTINFMGAELIKKIIMEDFKLHTKHCVKTVF